MKAHELRIGNWIDEQGIENQVTDLTWRHGEFETNGTMLVECEPIPLTEEWLLKFGFEYSDLNGDSGLWKIPPFQIYGKCNQFIYNYALDVNYVHQLQNLFHSLCGEELELKEHEKVKP